jgi:non-ribosomal peptide synthetase component F
MTLLASWQLLLSRYSGQEEVIVGTPVAGRHLLETEGSIGLFVNTLVLRGHTGGNVSFGEFLKRVRDTVLEAYGHQDVPFEKLVEELQPERSLGHNPLFQTMLVLQNNPVARLNLGGLVMEPQQTNTGAARFDLLLNLEEVGGGVRGVVEYNAELFDAETIEQLLEHFRRILEKLVESPEAHINTISLSKEESQELAFAFNDRLD